MYGARKNLISFDDISLSIPRLSASNLNIRRVIEKKTFGTALRKLLMVIASSLAICTKNEQTKHSKRFRCLKEIKFLKSLPIQTVAFSI